MNDDTVYISDLIRELVCYGSSCGLIADEDRTYCINRLLELFGQSGYAPSACDGKARDLHLRSCERSHTKGPF